MPGGLPSGWETYYVVLLSAVLALGLPAFLLLVSLLLRGSFRDPRLWRTDLGASASRNARSPQLPQVPINELGGFGDPGTAPFSATHLTAPLRSTELGSRINTRFFLGANAALLLITLGLVLIPCVGAIQPQEGREEVLKGLVVILSTAAFATLGLLYSARKGDLNWLTSYQAKPAPSESGVVREIGTG